MQTWFGFYALSGGAAATLMGLLFVSVSLNARVILGEEHQNSRRLAQQAFQNYLAVMLVSMLGLFPTMADEQLGWITLAATTVSGIWVVVRFYLALTSQGDRHARHLSVRRQYPSMIGFGMLLFSAVQMALKLDGSRNLFAASIIVLLVAATTVSWELLIGLAAVRDRSEAVQRATPAAAHALSKETAHDD